MDALEEECKNWKRVSDEFSNTIIMTVCSCHVKYAFQSDSTFYSCLNVKELLARNSREIWSLSDCNWTWIHHHLVSKRKLNHLAKLAKLFIYKLIGYGFEPSYDNNDKELEWISQEMQKTLRWKNESLIRKVLSRLSTWGVSIELSNFWS